MIVGALIDLGFPHSALNDGLRSLPLANFKTGVQHEQRMNIKGTRFKVHMKTRESTSRTFKNIRVMIEKSNLNSFVKEKSFQILHCLAKSEARIHENNIDEVHFHEIGGADSIIDIVGSVIGIHSLPCNSGDLERRSSLWQ